MGSVLHYVLILITFAFCKSSPTSNVKENSEIDYSLVVNEFVFEIEHDLGGSFKPRGKVNIIVKADGRQHQIIETDKNGIFSSNINDFKNLLSKNDLYRIRLRSSLNSSSCFSYVTAAIPSCELQKSGFKEDILLYLDVNNSNVIGITYSSPVIALQRPCDATKIKTQTLSFHSRIKLAENVIGQTVPLQVLAPRPLNLQKVKLGTEEEQKSEIQNQTFLQRYWYVVVIMIVYLFLGAKEEDPKSKMKAVAK